MRYRDCGEECRASLYIIQGGRCVICGRKGPLVIDHDHDTGEVRGLLCGNCNTGIGMLQDDENVIARALAYVINSGMSRPALTTDTTRVPSVRVDREGLCKDLTAAGCYQKYLEYVSENPGVNKPELVEVLGVSPSTISNYRRRQREILTADGDIQEDTEDSLDASSVI